GADGSAPGRAALPHPPRPGHDRHTAQAHGRRVQALHSRWLDADLSAVGTSARGRGSSLEQNRLESQAAAALSCPYFGALKKSKGTAFAVPFSCAALRLNRQYGAFLGKNHSCKRLSINDFRHENS